MTPRNAMLPVLIAALLVAISQAHAEEPVRLYAAGSLREVMTTMIAASGVPADQIAAPVFGPAAALRVQIEQGAPAAILASADLQQPRRLSQERGGRPVIVFAHGAMCAVTRRSLGATPANLLDKMLSPQVRVATSQPGADPSGDYAYAIFTRAEALRAGARASLVAKAIKLGGGSLTKPFAHSGAAGVFLDDRADILLTYCTGAASVIRDAPGLVTIPVPSNLTVTPTFGLVVLKDSAAADRLVIFIMSERGQAILASYGFKPASSEP